VADWGVVCLLAAYCGPNSPLARAMGGLCAGYGQLTGIDCSTAACAAVLQSMPVSCHFRDCKAPLSRIVSGAISSELALPLPLPCD